MVYRLPLNTGSCSPRAPLVDVQKEVVKGHPVSGQNFKDCICVFTLLGMRNG